MLKDKDMQLSIFSVLYNKIPENHTLKLLREEVDFSFINTLLEKPIVSIMVDRQKSRSLWLNF